MKFPTGGTAHEPQGMIRCDSEADSIVWMREDMFLTRVISMGSEIVIFQSFFILQCLTLCSNLLT